MTQTCKGTWHHLPAIKEPCDLMLKQMFSAVPIRAPHLEIRKPRAILLKAIGRLQTEGNSDQSSFILLFVVGFSSYLLLCSRYFTRKAKYEPILSHSQILIVCWLSHLKGFPGTSGPPQTLWFLRMLWPPPRVLIGSSLVKSRKSMTIATQKDWDWKLVTTIVGNYLPLLVYLMGGYGETTTSWSPPSANSTPLVKKCLKLRWQISWAPSIQRILVNPDAFQSFAPLLCHSQGSPLISPSIQCQSLMEKTAESTTCWPPRRLWFPSLQPKIA